MRTLKDGAGANREVCLAFIAAIEAALAGCDAILTTASRAGYALGPKPRFQVNPRCFRVWDQCEEFKGAYRALAHEPIVVNSLEGVKYYMFESCIYFQTVRGRMCGEGQVLSTALTNP